MLRTGHVDDDVQISALELIYEMDGRKGRFIGVLEWYRGEDAGDLKRSALGEKFWKVDQKVVMEEKLIRRSLWMRKVGKVGKVTRRS